MYFSFWKIVLFVLPIIPACRLIEQFGSRWALLVLLTLESNGTLRFSDLRRAIPGNVSERMLASTLHELEALRLIHRTLYPEIPPRVEYRLADECRTLLPILHRLIEWSQQHTETIPTTDHPAE